MVSQPPCSTQVNPRRCWLFQIRRGNGRISRTTAGIATISAMMMVIFRPRIASGEWGARNSSARVIRWSPATTVRADVDVQRLEAVLAIYAMIPTSSADNSSPPTVRDLRSSLVSLPARRSCLWTTQYFLLARKRGLYVNITPDGDSKARRAYKARFSKRPAP